MRGTERYSAPEISKGIRARTHDNKQYNEKVDIYSLAVIGLQLFGLKAEKMEEFIINMSAINHFIIYS